MSKSKAKGKDDMPAYEEAIEELEQILEQIESGEAGLDQTLAHYERGARLISHCRSILDAAEKRIAELTTSATGALSVRGEQGDSADEDG